MSQLFDIDISQLIRLKKFYKRAPNEFKKVSANVLNSFAFGTRAEALKVIKSKMIIRNERFVNSRLRVVRTSGNKEVSQQESIVGSISTKRFSGWKEQQFGTLPERDRTFTPFARRGDMKRAVLPSVRLKPSNKYVSSDEFAGKTPSQRLIVMLQVLNRKKYKKPFIIKHKSNKFKKGLYKFYGSGKNKKILALQFFNVRKAPKKIEWMTMASDNYFRKNNVENIWADSMKRILKF